MTEKCMTPLFVDLPGGRLADIMQECRQLGCGELAYPLRQFLYKGFSCPVGEVLQFRLQLLDGNDAVIEKTQMMESIGRYFSRFFQLRINGLEETVFSHRLEQLSGTIAFKQSKHLIVDALRRYILNQIG